jgi:hypothetical protein
METMEHKKFKKQLLYRDQSTIDAQIKQMESAADTLNSFITTAEKVLRIIFNEDEKLQIKDNGVLFIKSTIAKSFPFPAADEAFNLNAIGMQEVTTLYTLYNAKVGMWQSFNYQLNKKGVFELAPMEKEKTAEAWTSYTQNQKQNEALRIAESLVSLFDEAESLKLLNYYGKQQISNVFDLLTIEVDPTCNDYRIRINKHSLRGKFLV